jgi:hypothetical protein
MSEETSSLQVEQASEIRARYNRALGNSYRIYCESEDVAAFLSLEIRRLSKSLDEKDQDKLREKQELVSRVKDNMLFILDKMSVLSKEKNEFLSDLYTSSKIVDLEDQLTDLTPWLDDLSQDVELQAHEARMNAKITSEINHSVRVYNAG